MKPSLPACCYFLNVDVLKGGFFILAISTIESLKRPSPPERVFTLTNDLAVDFLKGLPGASVVFIYVELPIVVGLY